MANPILITDPADLRAQASDVLYQLYLTAKAKEDRHWGEADSLDGVCDGLLAHRCSLEDAFLRFPSINCAAFAQKVLIALSDDRELRGDWTAILVDEARQLAAQVPVEPAA